MDGGEAGISIGWPMITSWGKRPVILEGVILIDMRANGRQSGHFKLVSLHNFAILFLRVALTCSQH